MPDTTSAKLHPWARFRLAGLDTPIYALTWLHLHAICFKLHIPPLQYALLAAAIWIVQSLDQLLDLRYCDDADPLIRTRKRLRPLHITGILLLAPFILWKGLTEIPGTLLMGGITVSILVILYILHAQRLRSATDTILPKEIFQAFLLALAIALPSADALGQLNSLNAHAWIWGWKNSALSAIGLTLQWLLLILATQLSRPEIFFTAAFFFLHRLGASIFNARTSNNPDPAALIRFRPASTRGYPVMLAALTAAALVWAIFPISGAHLVLRPYYLCVAAASALLLIAHSSQHRKLLKPEPARSIAILAPILPVAIFTLLR